MRIIFLAIIILLIAAFIPKEKCDMKFLVIYIGVLLITLGLTGYQHINLDHYDFFSLLTLNTDRLEATLNVLAIYCNLGGCLIVLVKFFLLTLKKRRGRG